MKTLSFILISGLLLTSLSSCDKEVREDKVVPVEYFLSTEDEELFNAFEENMSISFEDQEGSVLDFQADSIYHITMCKESSIDKGEALFVRYNCLTEYLPNFTANCRLSAKPDGRIVMSLNFATGTSSTSTNNDYVLSLFNLDPNTEGNLNNVNYSGTTVHQEYLGSVTLNGTTFNNVFYSSHVLLNPDAGQTRKVYYTIADGLVAFENNDDKLWVRQ